MPASAHAANPQDAFTALLSAVDTPVAAWWEDLMFKLWPALGSPPKMQWKHTLGGVGLYPAQWAWGTYSAF